MSARLASSPGSAHAHAHALALLQRGAAMEAAEAFAGIAAANPADAAALALRGLALCQSGQPQAALAPLRRAVALDASAFHTAGLAQALAAAGHGREAVAAWQRAIALAPGVAAAHLGLGHALRALGRTERAIAALQTGLRLAPDDLPAQLALAALLRGRPDLPAARAAAEAAVTQAPGAAEAWCCLGNILLDQGEPLQAARAQTQAEALAPGLAEAAFGLGNALCALDDCTGAVAAYRRALATRPDFPQAWCNLANALHDLEEPEQALAAADAALRLAPDFADAHTVRGNTLQALLRFHAAEAAHRAAHAQQPRAAAPLSNLAVALTAQERLEEAASVQRRAMRLDPDFPGARINHAVTLLAQGDYEQGWRFYEERWRMPWSPPHGLPQPLWLGGPVEGRSVLLHAEQGLGDTLMMARFAPLLAGRGARVLLRVQAPLARLLAAMPGIAAVSTLDDPPPACDLQCPMFSLPLAFATTLATVPATPYLRPDPALAAAWAMRLGPATGLRVGLVWAGAEKIGRRVNAHRSVPLALLAPLARLPGVECHSLQLGPASDQHATLPPDITLIDHTADIADFADTAALVAQLDLVIAVDTSTAHLAAAMGKPVWLLHRVAGCWRWLTARPDSPWYPSLRIFRQHWIADAEGGDGGAGDWTPALTAITQALAGWATTGVQPFASGAGNTAEVRPISQ